MDKQMTITREQLEAWIEESFDCDKLTGTAQEKALIAFGYGFGAKQMIPLVLELAEALETCRLQSQRLQNPQTYDWRKAIIESVVETSNRALTRAAEMIGIKEKV